MFSQQQDIREELVRQLNVLISRGRKEYIDLAAKIQNGEIRLADMQIVSTVDGGGVNTIKMFKTDDNKIDGLKSLDRGKLPKGKFMLVDRIQVLAVTLGAAYSDAGAAAGNFGLITGIAGLPTGWLNVIANKKPVINELPNQVFVTNEQSTVQRGTYFLNNPFMLTEEEGIEANFELKSPAAANTAVKLIFGGVGTIPA